MIKDSIEALTENDAINLVLYSIYLISKDPEYSTIGELIYTLDKDNFYKFISEFGGTTIKVPTLDELRSSLKALMIYQEVELGSTLSEAIKNHEVSANERKYILQMYEIISNLMENHHGQCI